MRTGRRGRTNAMLQTVSRIEPGVGVAIVFCGREEIMEGFGLARVGKRAMSLWRKAVAREKRDLVHRNVVTVPKEINVAQPVQGANRSVFGCLVVHLEGLRDILLGS